MMRFKKAAIPAEIRRQVATLHGCKVGETVNAKCAYCPSVGEITWFAGAGRKNSHGWVAFSGLELDHVHAEYNGGPTTIGNIVLACLPCNRSKSTKALDQWRPANA